MYIFILTQSISGISCLKLHIRIFRVCRWSYYALLEIHSARTCHGFYSLTKHSLIGFLLSVWRLRYVIRPDWSPQLGPPWLLPDSKIVHSSPSFRFWSFVFSYSWFPMYQPLNFELWASELPIIRSSDVRFS